MPMTRPVLYKQKRRALTQQEINIVRASLRAAIRNGHCYVADPRDTQIELNNESALFDQMRNSDPSIAAKL